MRPDRGLSLLETLVVLLLTAVVLLVTGLHLRQAIRLGMTPLDRGRESLELASRQLLQEVEGALGLQWVSGQLRLSRAPLGNPGRLPAAGTSWAFDSPLEEVRYECREGQFWRSQSGRDLRLCPAERFLVALSSDGGSLQFELAQGTTSVRRTVYRWVR